MAQPALHLIFSADAERRVAYVNASIRDVLGYNPDEVVGAPSGDLVHPDDAEAVDAAWQRLTDGEPLRRLTLRVRRRDGSYVPFLLDVLPRLGRDGRFEGVDGIGCPERPSALPHELALEQVASLRNLGETPPAADSLPRALAPVVRYPMDLGAEACWVGLLEAGTLDVRPAAHAGPDGEALAAAEAGRADQHGPIARALIARRPVVAHLDDRAETAPLVAAARRRGYRALAVLPLIDGGQPVGVACLYSRRVGFFDEATLRLLNLFAQAAAAMVVSGRALERARQIELRFRDLVGHLPCVVYVSRPTFPPEFIFVSSNCERYAGVTAEEIYADGAAVFEIVHPDDRPRVVELVRRATGRDEPYSFEYRFRNRKTGEEGHAVAHSIPVHDDQGRLVLREGILLDVTERRRLEQELLQSQRLAAIGEMAAMMAHEIRNPLAGMSLALRVLRGAGGEQETQAECLDDLAQCLSRINATVSRVLDFSKARPVALRRCTLAEVLDAAQRLTATYLRKSDVALELALPEGLPSLVGDPDQLEQVFVNLILNACRAMPDGGRVTVSARAGDEEVRAEVADTGTGIAPEQLDQIFDPFYSAFGSGTGLGLTLCRRIVRAHGGRIGVQSRPGEGTTFRIDLPLEPPHAPPAGH